MAKSIHYLAFGDSLTVGYGALRHQGFANLLKVKWDELAGIHVDYSNAGTNGATTERLLDILETEPELIQLMKHANVITITAGGNDLLQAALPYIQGGSSSLLKSTLQAYEMNYRRILKQIEKVKGDSTNGGPYVIILIGLYNPLPQVPESAYWVLHFNQFLSSLQKKKKIRIVQVYDAFQGKEAKLLYVDHIHPNAAGYQVIADQVLRDVPIKVIRDLV